MKIERHQYEILLQFQYPVKLQGKLYVVLVEADICTPLSVVDADEQV